MNDWRTIYKMIKVIQTWGNCWECFPGKYLVGRLWCNPIFRHCRRKPIKRDLLPRQPPTGSQEIILLQLSVFLGKKCNNYIKLINFSFMCYLEMDSGVEFFQAWIFLNSKFFINLTFSHLMQLRHFGNKAHLDNYVFISVTILRFYCQSCGW